MTSFRGRKRFYEERDGINFENCLIKKENAETVKDFEVILPKKKAIYSYFLFWNKKEIQ